MKIRIAVLEAHAKKPYSKWDYTYPTELPAIPRTGERLDIWRTDMAGNRIIDRDSEFYSKLERYLVEDVAWQITLPDDGKSSYEAGKAPIGALEDIIIWVSPIKT